MPNFGYQMRDTMIKEGTMFVRMPYDWDETKTVAVYVKVGEFKQYGRTYSRFVENNALALFGAISKPIGFDAVWGIGEDYYDTNVKSGRFIPIEDLREVEILCEKLGVNPPPPIDLEKESLKMLGIAE